MSAVQTSITTTLVSPISGREMAAMYLPDDDIGNRWFLEKVTWLPSNESLADLPWPVVPDTDSIGDAPPVSADGPTAYYGQVVLADIPQEINPGAEGLTFIGGTLNGATLRIRKKRISIEVPIARRIPKVIATSPALGVTPADLAVDFPTIRAVDVDPAITAYDVRLVHP